MVSTTTGDTYYYNTTTGESDWDAPALSPEEILRAAEVAARVRAAANLCSRDDIIVVIISIHLPHHIRIMYIFARTVQDR
jgi:hypothetical protein